MKPDQSIDRRQFLKATGILSAAVGLAPHFAKAEAGAGLDTFQGRKIRVGLIGCGNVSAWYLSHLTKQPFIEMVSVCDVIIERAKKRAEEFKLPNVYPNVAEMLAGATFDLLVNTTSMPSHYYVNRKALEARRHVWSEKPLASRVKDAKQLLALATRVGVRLWGAPTCVTSPQFQFMAETIASGKIGKVMAGHGIYGHRGPGWSAWFYEKGGGSLYDLGVYNVTTLTGLLGPAKEVVGMTAVINPARKVEDKGEVKVTADENTMLLMHHGNGVLSHVQTGFVYFNSERLAGEGRQLYTIDVTGTKGTMHLQGWDWEPAGVDIAYDGEAVLETFCKERGKYNWVGGASYAAECLLSGKAGLITPEHAIHVLEVMNACHTSQRTGRRISIENTFKWPVCG